LVFDVKDYIRTGETRGDTAGTTRPDRPFHERYCAAIVGGAVAPELPITCSIAGTRRALPPLP
jgi:hypothetical protein